MELADQESMSCGKKKARNHQKRSSKTHRFTTNPTSRTNYTTSPGNFHLPKMEAMLNPPFPYPSSSSLPLLESEYYSINRFQQPPLLPLPMAAFSSSSSSSSSVEFNRKVYTKDKNHTKQALKKNPDLNPKRRGPDPESEMNFCESLIYAMSPSPSSLPMPKFAKMKPKLAY